jgi:hypothetical protein
VALRCNVYRPLLSINRVGIAVCAGSHPQRKAKGETGGRINSGVLTRPRARSSNEEADCAPGTPA